jgi:hypothetical protein
VHYPGDCVTPTADLLTMNLLLNSYGAMDAYMRPRREELRGKLCSSASF